jgi:hypothetical protein
MLENGASINAAIRGYAENGDVTKVEALLEKVNQQYLDSARFGYLEGDQLSNPDNILEILATTKDPMFRRYLANLHFAPNLEQHKEERDTLLQHATEINRNMKIYTFTFAQALELDIELKRINDKYKVGYLGQLFQLYTDNSSNRFKEILDSISAIRKKGMDMQKVHVSSVK